MVTGLGRDFALAARRLAAAPLFTVFAVLSLAVGVGLTTAVYSIVDSIFWKSSGISDADRVVAINAGESLTRDLRWQVSLPDFEDFRSAQQSFQSVSASQLVFPAVGTDMATEIQPTEAVDGDYFATLGVVTAIGRSIAASDVASASPVAVISHALWRSRFGADPNVVGRTLRLSGRPFEIIGVAPASFEGLVGGPRAARLWVPLPAGAWFSPPPRATIDPRERMRYAIVGRLRPGRSLADASLEAATFSAALDRSHPRATGSAPGRKAGRAWTAMTLPGPFGREGDMLGRVGVLVLGLVALVLVVACTNLANLILARGTIRQHEIAVRRALGASRWRLVREQCAESALLAALGGAAAYGVLVALMRVMDTEIPMASSWMVSVQPQINASVLVATATAVVVSLLVFGVEPALQLTRTRDVRDVLGSTAGGVGVPKAKRQRRLLRWQVAISAGFFILSSTTVRYLVAHAGHDSGMDLDRLSIADVNFQLQRWDENRARLTLDRLIDEARKEAGVEATTASTGLPFGTTITPALRLARPDDPKLSSERQSATLVIATPGFFRTTGVAILRGRAFDERDAAGGAPVVVLDETTARRVFGSVDVVGRQVLMQVDTASRGLGTEQPQKIGTVIGIAEDTDAGRFAFSGRRGGAAYMPLAQEYSPLMTIVVRAETPAIGQAAIRAAARRADSDLALSSTIGSGEQVLGGPFVFIRTLGVAALALGGITLLLAMVGLYGVQSHIVAHRTREIGVRMSLGATASQVRAMVLRDGYWTVLQGLALGLFLGVVLRAGFRAVVVSRIPLLDPWMFVLAPVPLILAAFFACYLPARRASRVDPNVALRHL